uniref:Serum response factor-binding protein 1 n=1 Tax=Phallusia mammillata TaxID=59560 RepID=A0A6F9DU73_9ASCI|nr:serum response factor-binding protein 1-like [Phallusia mammillata]
MDTNKLNNEMILMRKSFKKAKVHVISKLVRQIRQLRNKKGSDLQIQKHKNRADRLVEEIDTIKDLKPDKIFKHLLSLDQGPKHIGQLQDVTIQDRALARIGLVPFVKQRMDEIREQVASFDFVRSKKGSVTAIRVSSKLAKLETLSKENDSDDTPKETKHNPDVTSTERHLPPTLNPTTPSSDIKQLNNDRMQSHQSDETLPSTTTNTTLQTYENLTPPMESPTFQPIETICDISDGVDFSDSDSASSDNDQFDDQTVSVSETSKIQTKPLDIAAISHTDNITEVLENIGKGFCDSENEQETEDHSDNEDVMLDDEESEDQGGSFFMDSLDSKPRKPIGMQKVDSKSLNTKSNHMKSSFVSSLSHSKPLKSKSSRAAPQDSSDVPRKKKNRLGQRARQKLYGSTGDMKPRSKDIRGKNSTLKNQKVGKNLPKVQDSSNSRKEEFTEKENPAQIHPSWQASQARKQQLQIQSFQGKRIKFDDSD